MCKRDATHQAVAEAEHGHGRAAMIGHAAAVEAALQRPPVGREPLGVGDVGALVDHVHLRVVRHEPVVVRGPQFDGAPHVAVLLVTPY